MATVTVFTAERMQEIEDSAVVGGTVVDGHLILERHNGTTFDAGVVTSDGGGGTVKQILIASSDANTSTKARADYICDGVHDEEEIRAAIEELYDDGTWGQAGEILLSEGFFYIDLTGELDEPGAPIDLHHVTLAGIGKDNTYLEISHPDTPAFQLEQCTVKNLTVEDTPNDGEPQIIFKFDDSARIENVIITAITDNIGAQLIAEDAVMQDCTIYCNGGGIGVNFLHAGQLRNCRFLSYDGADNVRIDAYESYSVCEYKVQILNCQFFSAGSSDNRHIHFPGVDTSTNSFANCLISECTFSCEDTGFAIFSTWGDYESHSSLRIVNCKFQDNGRTNTAIALHGQSTVFIESNKFNGFETALDLNESISTKVIGNQFLGAKYPITALDSHRLSIENNTFHGFTDPMTVGTAVVGQIAILVTTSEQIFITGNQLELISEHGMVLTTCVHAVVSNNFLWRCGNRADNTYSGLRLLTSDYASILGNRFLSQAPANELKYGIEIGAGSDFTYVRGNNIYGSYDTAGIQDGGSSTDTTSANKL